MAKQEPWDLYEAAILLDAYILVAEGKKNRRQAIVDVSNMLRKRAEAAGREIDEVFRNKAGITFQMSSMESAYLGRTVHNTATKLFIEIVEIRKSDRERFDEILKEAKGVAAVDGRTKYQEWLVGTGMKNTAARNYGNWLNYVDSYAREVGYVDCSIYDYDDAEKLVELYKKISNDPWAKEHRDSMTSLRKFILYRSGGDVQLVRRRITPSEVHFGRYEYQEWLEDNGFKNTAARNYGNWLNNIDAYAIEQGYSNQSVYDIDDTDVLLEIFEKLNSDDEIINNHRDYLTSFKKFIAYRSDGTIELARDRSSKKDRVVHTKSAVENANAICLSDVEINNYSQILLENFEDGLVLNAIRLDMFRMLYEEKYGVALTQDDDILTENLKAVGSLVDGRIYPRKDTKNSELLSEIREVIFQVLNNGVSCVYISEVMNRWQQQLAEELYIYNEDALRDIVLADNMDGIVSTSIVFKKTKERVYSEKDVIEFMKQKHAPVKYDDFLNEMWYIPLDVIKRILVTTPSLVQVDFETYMYAPNFPASSIELNKLERHMKKKIDEKGFLVSKDIADIIEQKCPAIFINTEGYKDWAYRNVLRYLFRDQFDFGSSVVCEKGKGLEMKQVYRSFCKDYEHLTFEELKDFSGEVGVQIYWDDVLEEMVRINEKELVRKDKVHFDVNAIDSVLDEFCTGEYIPIKQVNLFLHFPTIEYPWNSFVLESYLSRSQRFKLYHVSYSDNRVFGVIVRKNSKFEDYRQVVIDMLARSNEWNTEANALALIVEKGYQARKRWTGFDKVIQETLVYREKLNEERK